MGQNMKVQVTRSARPVETDLKAALNVGRSGVKKRTRLRVTSGGARGGYAGGRSQALACRFLPARSHE